MADLGDLLWIAGAIGVGVLLHKRSKAKALVKPAVGTSAATATAAAAVTAPAQAVVPIRDEGAELFAGNGAYQPWGSGYAPNYNFYGQRRGR